MFGRGVVRAAVDGVRVMRPAAGSFGATVLEPAGHRPLQMDMGSGRRAHPCRQVSTMESSRPGVRSFAVRQGGNDDVLTPSHRHTERPPHLGISVLKFGVMGGLFGGWGNQWSMMYRVDGTRPADGVGSCSVGRFAVFDHVRLLSREARKYK